MENKLEVIKKALEMGAWTNLSIHSERSKAEAEKLSKELAETLGSDYKESSGTNCHWYDVGNFNFGITVHYRESKEDEIRKLELKLKELKEETA